MKKMKKTLIVLLGLIVGFQMKTDASAAELTGKWDFIKIVVPSIYDDVYSMFTANLISAMEPQHKGTYVQFENDTDFSMQASNTSADLIHSTYQKMDESTIEGYDMYSLGGFENPIPMWHYENQLAMKFESVFTREAPDNTPRDITVDIYFVFENKELDGSPSKVFTADNIASLEKDSSVDIPDSFSNKFGTPTTKCAHSGCENYVASSGATDCCPDHSNKCFVCGKYITDYLTVCYDCAIETIEKQNASENETVDKFTNKYGTPTTKCAHPGCGNYIASSGDTNCCTVHSNKCLNCNKYIDEDAAYCMDCLSSSISSKSKEDRSDSSSTESQHSSGTCQYKEGGVYVCDKPATKGQLCQEHFDYLNGIYNSLTGN